MARGVLFLFGGYWTGFGQVWVGFGRMRVGFGENWPGSAILEPAWTPTHWGGSPFVEPLRPIWRCRPKLGKLREAVPTNARIDHTCGQMQAPLWGWCDRDASEAVQLNALRSEKKPQGQRHGWNFRPFVWRHMRWPDGTSSTLNSSGSPTPPGTLKGGGEVEQMGPKSEEGATKTCAASVFARVRDVRPSTLE